MEIRGKRKFHGVSYDWSKLVWSFGYKIFIECHFVQIFLLGSRDWLPHLLWPQQQNVPLRGKALMKGDVGKIKKINMRCWGTQIPVKGGSHYHSWAWRNKRMKQWVLLEPRALKEWVPAGRSQCSGITTWAETPQQNESEEKYSDFSFFLPVPCRYFPLANYKQKPSDKEPKWVMSGGGVEQRE